MAKKQYRTARGLNFDMETFTQSKSEEIALGNLGGTKSVNARGDVLGKGGKVEVTREEFVRKYYREEPPKVKEAPLSALATGPGYSKEEVFKSPTEVMKDLNKPAEEKPAAKSTRRSKNDGSE